MKVTREVEGWGRFPRIKSEVYRPNSLKKLKAVVSQCPHILAFGSNLSYGDCSLARSSVDMKLLNKFLSFDRRRGVVKVEAGLVLEDLLEVVVPRGWMVPVSPGTKFVTIGGLVASDVHGRNHHVAGCFGDHVVSMDIVLASGELVTCTAKKNSDLFEAVIGGQGLLGIIYAVEFKLKRVESSFMDVYKKKCYSFAEIIAVLDKADSVFPYTVCWIDTFSSKGIVMAAKFSEQGELKWKKRRRYTVPFTFPSLTLNKTSMGLFNWLYFAVSRSGRSRAFYDSFFYPLDAVHKWNRLYGKKGFFQYQCILPKEGIKEVLAVVAEKGSFLSVLKKFGPEKRLLSFPKEGYTLTLDFPVCQANKKLAEQLDTIVLRYNGRLYLSKDALMSKDFFESMYPNLDEWKKIKKKYDPKDKFVSLQARRLGLV
jgi:decaprenylphospho-beta-D-ribofuranose 2-oxidase